MKRQQPESRRLLARSTLLAIVCVLSACRTESPVASPHERQPPAPTTWNLPVMEVVPEGRMTQKLPGTVVSDTRIELASRIGGRIADMRVEVGDAVRRGQLLVRLDAPELEGSILQARSGASAAGAAARDAAADLAVYRALAERGSASNNELRKVQLRHDAARGALQQALAVQDTALAQRGQARLESPVDGVVVARSRRTGDLALPGQPLLTVEAAGPLHFELQLPASQLSQVKPGQVVEVWVDGHHQALMGTVDRVLPSSDSVARRHTVKIDLRRAAGLAAGQFGRVGLVIDERAGLRVPRHALIERGGLLGVFVVDADDRARFRWLRTGGEWSVGSGDRASDRIEVTAGLKPHERVVARADPALREGDRISTAVASRGSPP